MNAATPRTVQHNFFITGTTIPLVRTVGLGRDRVEAAVLVVVPAGFASGGSAIAVAMTHHSNG